MESIVKVIRKFNRFYTNILGLLDQHLLESEFTLSEARVLFEIGHTQNCTAKMLIDQLGLDAGYLSRILKRFTAHDLVNRTQSEEDGRLQYLQLTGHGKDILAILDKRSDKQIQALIDPLPDKVQRRLAANMTAIEHALSDKPQIRQEIRIRSNLQHGDVGKLIHLHGWIYAEECGYNHIFEGYVCQTFADFFKNYKPDVDRFWFAENGDEMVGAIAILGHSERAAQLRWFILHPEHRGGGIGKRMLEEALEYSKKQGFQRVFLETTSDQKTAIAMYTKAGFKKIREHAQRAWGIEHIEETYELILG